MRRLLTLAAFLLIFAMVPVCAQRGGHSSSGSHGGFSGGHGGGGLAGHSGFAAHTSGSVGFGSSHFNSRMSPLAGSHYALGSRYGSSFGRGEHAHSRGRRFNRDGFRNRGCYGCLAYGYPYYGFYDPYFYDPYWWSDSYSSYDEDAARDRELASEMNRENLEEQRSLRDPDQRQYSRPMTRQSDTQSRADTRAENDPPTVLIFRDQQQREIQNYAIVGQTIWNFAQQRTEKIPLSAIDIPATIKANDDRGVDFRLPGSSEGQ
jgi:hypothetical protein